MNKKIFIKLSFVFILVILSINLLIGFYISENLVYTFGKNIQTRIEKNLYQITAIIRNRLLLEDIKSAGLILEEFRMNETFDEYAIFRKGQIVQKSKNYTSFRDSYRIVTKIPIYFRNNGEEWGSVEYYSSVSEYINFANSIKKLSYFGFWGMLGIFVIFLGIIFYLFWRANSQMTIYFRELFLKNEKLPVPKIVLHMWKPLVEMFQKLSFDIKKWQLEIIEQKKSLAMLKIAQQLAHDIRSPVAALDVAMEDINTLPESTRILVRSAVQRIHDIANNLLIKNRPQQGAASIVEEDYEKLSVELISCVVDSMLSEKRLQYRSSPNLEIERTAEDFDFGLFAKVNLPEFKRILSNLINNAVEAFENKTGKIEVSITGEKEFITIKITDNGKGIPADVLPKLMQRGQSHGKKSGSGLGLVHAKENLEAWNGKIEIESTVGAGTKIHLILKREKSPSWFCEKLSLTAGQQVVVVDDDASIHEIWKSRMLGWTEKKELQLAHYFSPEYFFNSVHLKDWRAHLFLVDFEFLGSKFSGLDVIEKAGIAPNAVLVTSRYEDEKIRKRCEELKLKIIPKMESGAIPIVVHGGADPRGCLNHTDGHGDPPLQKGKNTLDAILIDDDEMIHMVWKVQAKANQKEIRRYFSVEEFLKEMSAIDKATPIYVDENLGEGKSGVKVSKELSEYGFRNIYLSTGYTAEHFQEPMPWLKGIIGKEPPWS